jgi:site-specific recombinase XerD
VILKSKAKKAGIEDVSPHDLWRTFITSLFEAGNDIMFVAARGGHVSLSTTRQYDIVGEKGKKPATSLALSSRAARRN